MRRSDWKHELYLNNKKSELSKKYNISIKNLKRKEESIFNKLYKREIKKYNGLIPGGLRNQAFNILERYLQTYEVGCWKKFLKKFK